ncbi:hypothetical protein L7F22_050833 [Adiantum nelumboides]|nr:hypothetical protein [Adiantum nelumboides]
MACAQASLWVLANTNKMELSRVNFRLKSALSLNKSRRSALPWRRPLTVATQESGNQPTSSSSSSSALQQQSGGGGSPSRPPTTTLDRPSLATSLMFDRLDPFHLTTSSIKQMLDVVDRFFGDVASPGKYFRVPWDIAEDDECYKLRIDMPGFSKDDVKVHVEDEVLVIGAESNKEQGDQQDKSDDKASFRSRNAFHTKISLPKNTEVDKINAKLVHGLLEVRIPKKKVEKQVVDVQVN